MIRRCGYWSDNTKNCHQTTGVRFYLVGWRCPAHTPAALNGRPDIIPDPKLTLDALRVKAGRVASFNPNDTALNDQRAIASGRRRSNTQAYRDAQAAEDQRKAARHEVANR